MEAGQLRRRDRAPSSPGTTSGGAARRRWTRTEFTFFDDTGAMVTAYQGGQIDAIVQFDVLTGAPLFTDANFTVVDTPTTNHRQIWMRCDTGQFADKRVRQALALTIDRPALIQQLFKGKGELGQRPRHLEVLSVLQRHRHAARAGHREGQAAPVGRRQVRPEGHAPVRQAQRDPGPCRPPPEPWRPRRVSRSRRPARTTTRSTICSGARPSRPIRRAPAPPNSASSTTATAASPDVFLNSAFKTKGVWNASQYSSPAFDAAFTEFQSAVGVDAQKAACAKIETIMQRGCPGRPSRTWYNYLSGNSKKFTGVYTCALGQMFLSAASTA